MLSTIFLVFIVFLLVMVVAANVRIVPQANRLRHRAPRDPTSARGARGCTSRCPLSDRIANRVSVKEQVVDFAPQSVITKDNVTMQIDTVVFFQVTDAKMLTYGVEFPSRRDREPHRDDAAQHHRLDGARPHAHLARLHQHEHNGDARQGDRQMGASRSTASRSRTSSRRRR